MRIVAGVLIRSDVIKMANKGKDWEGVVRSTLEQHEGVSLDRFPDPQMGYKGIRNICDFGVYVYPFKIYLECKTVKGNTLPFGNITDNQREGMLEKSQIKGCVGIVLIWFSDWDTVVAIDVDYIQMRREGGAKSFNIKELDGELRGHFVEVPCRVPRTNPKIDKDDLVRVLTDFGRRKWTSNSN